LGNFEFAIESIRVTFAPFPANSGTLYPEIFDGLRIGGVYVHEPGALLSNFALAMTGWIVFFALRKRGDEISRRWSLFAMFLALGTTGGMWVHGFPHLFSPRAFYLLWAVKNSCVPLADFFALSACAAYVPTRWQTTYLVAIAAKAFTAVFLLFLTYSFLPAAVDLGLSYAAILVLTFSDRRRTTYAKWIFRAFLTALLSGLLYVFKWDVDPVWFSHKDMVHLFAILSLCMIFRANRGRGGAG